MLFQGSLETGSVCAELQPGAPYQYLLFVLQTQNSSWFLDTIGYCAGGTCG